MTEERRYAKEMAQIQLYNNWVHHNNKKLHFVLYTKLKMWVERRRRRREDTHNRN